MFRITFEEKTFRLKKLSKYFVTVLDKQPMIKTISYHLTTSFFIYRFLYVKNNFII